jgi:hypothetical protein
MLDGIATVESGIEDELIAGVIDDRLIETGNSWEERQAELETLSGAVSEEIQRREDLMKDAYPFDVASGSLRYRPSKTGVYEFCLAVSQNPKGTDQGNPHASTVFEWIARDVLKAHFGDDSQGFRTGWPPHVSEGRGSRTKETFQLLTQQCGEFRWDPGPLYPADPDPKLLKDCGMDVVVWKPWPDSRLGQFIVLGQCACGKNDINAAKGRELSMTRLANWLRPITYSSPVRSFLTALHIPNIVALYELSQEAGLVLDRARLTMVAERFPQVVTPPPGFSYHDLAKLYATQQAA